MASRPPQSVKDWFSRQGTRLKAWNRSYWQRLKAGKRAYLYILPAAVVMLMITLYPLLFQLFMAFTNYAPPQLRLNQVQAVEMVLWDAGVKVPDAFKKKYTAQYKLEKGKSPGDSDIRSAFRETEQYKDACVAQMLKIGIKANIAKIAARRPLEFRRLENFLDIVFNSRAASALLHPDPAKIPQGQSLFSYRLEKLREIFKGQLPIANYDFGRLFIFNLLWTFINVFLHVTVGVMIAVVLNLHGVRLRGFYRAFYILPYAIPSFVTAIVWRYMFDQQFGAINQFFVLINDFLAAVLGQNPATFALLPEGIRWLQDLKAPFGLDILPLSFYAALITNVWLGWPFMMIVATGALQSIPKELYQAAEVDGASFWQRFWRITVPLLRPAMAPAIMFGVIWTFNQFNVMYLVTEGRPIGRTEIMVTQAYRLVQEHRVYGVAAAFSIVVFIILFTLNLVLNRISRATEAAYE